MSVSSCFYRCNFVGAIARHWPHGEKARLRRLEP
jgi:hypothetical protein